MTTLFERSVELDIKLAGSIVLTVKNLRVAFDVKKNNSSTPNNTKITIFNLSDVNRELISGSGLECVLKAGYKGIDSEKPILNTLLIGDIKTISHELTEADFLTVLEVVEKSDKLTKTHIEENFGEGIKTSTVLRKILQKIGIKQPKINTLLSRISFRKQWVNGLTLSGNFKSIMDNIIDYEGYEWYFDNDDLIVQDNRRVTFTDFVLISKDTGMIGYPKKKEKGYEIDVLIQSGLSVGKIVKIESEIITAFLKITEVQFSGDTDEGNWKTKIIAQEIG